MSNRGPLLPLFLRLQLAKEGALNLKNIRFFVLDECDKMLEKLGEQGAAARVARPAGSAARHLWLLG